MQTGGNRCNRRRGFFIAAISLCLALSSFSLPGLATGGNSSMVGLSLALRAMNGDNMKISILGACKCGETLGALWVKAGHQVMFSSGDTERDKVLAAGLGSRASAGTLKQAGTFGEILLLSVPYAEVQQISRDLRVELQGKVVFDASNSAAVCNGDVVAGTKERWEDSASSLLHSGAQVVRAFSSVSPTQLEKEAHRAGEQIAIPLAADDAWATKVAVRLVRDAGFEPVVIGELGRAKEFDLGTPVFFNALTGAELRQQLGVKP